MLRQMCQVEAYNSLCQTKGKPRVEAAELLRTTYVVYHWNRDCQVKGVGLLIVSIPNHL